MKDRLFWERFRPKKFENVVLVPRIKNFVGKGIKTNLLFYGHTGIGKSTVARILTENTNVLKINCKKDKGIDIVREQIDSHCKEYGIFVKRDDEGTPLMKTVLLEEFDGATKSFQEALNDFIEEYEQIARFVATVNNLNKITPEMQGRFNLVNFDPITLEEKTYVQDNYFKYLKAIANHVKFEIEDNMITKIVNNTFPDCRSAVQLLQELTISNDFSSVEDKLNVYSEEVYSFILDGKNEIKDNYFFVLDNFKDKSETLLKALSRPFFEYLMQYDKDKALSIGQKFILISKEYNQFYTQTVDPELHLISYVTDLKALLNE